MKPKIAIGTIQDTLAGLLKGGGKIEVCTPVPDRNLYQFNGLVNYTYGDNIKTFDVEIR